MARDGPRPLRPNTLSPPWSRPSSTLNLKYKISDGKTGETKVNVVPTTSIVSVTPGSKDDLKKGAVVFAIYQALPDGSLKTGFLLVGRGVGPPMLKPSAGRSIT
jgi:hypothetical protein